MPRRDQPPENQAHSRYFYKSELEIDRPKWAEGVKIDPRKLNAKRAWVRALAAEYTGEAIQALIDCLKDPDGQVRLRAAQAILDRAWGKPEPARDTDDETRPTDPDELLRRITIQVTGSRAPIDLGPALLPERGG